MDRGIAEAEEALRVDPDLPYGHFVLGTAYGIKGADAPAKQAFLRALELDPNNVVAMNNFSVHETAYGRLDEGLYWGKRGFALSGKTGNDYHVSVPLAAIRADDVHRRWLLDAERRFPGFDRVQIMLSWLEALLLTRRDRCPERLSDVDGDLGLHPQDVGELPVVLLRPQRLLRRGIDQLRTHACAISLDAHTAVHEMTNAKLAHAAGDLVLVVIQPVSAQQAQRRDLRQLAADFLGHPGREVRVLRIDGEGAEWPHREQRTIRFG